MGTTRNGRHVSQETDDSSDDEMAVHYAFREFSDVWDPIAAMMWISQMEYAFNDMKCADEDKVTYAVSMLRSGALVWWDSVKDTSGPEDPTKMTWSRFKEVFKDEFYPARVEVELIQQFRTLKQESNESLQKYTDCFQRLWWFFSDHLTREKRLIYYYVGGLSAYIKDFITPSDMTTLDSVIQAARVIDIEYKSRLQDKRYFRRKRERRMCMNKGMGDCRYGCKGCYRCGKPGHLARACGSYW